MAFDTDVLIIGAGPVGLTLACELARRRVRHQIIDKAKTTKDISKALIIHVRTQEVFDAMGMIEAERALSIPLRHVEVQAHGKHIGTWRLDQVESPYQSPIIIGQDRTERVLREHLVSLGGKVEWGVEAKAYVQDADGVTTTLSGVDGVERTVRSRYVVGAEGSKSLVRAGAGIDFQGDHYEGEQFIQADCRIRSTLPRGASHLFLTSQGYMMIIEMPDDIVRIFISLPSDAALPKLVESGDNVQFSTPPTLEDVQLWLNKLGAVDAELSDPVWLARYRTSHRVAASLRRGRAFIAGDAGHVHVPFGGQGMNTGIQDAFNLGWKLAATLHGECPESILNSYDAERRPVAEALIKGTDKAYRFVLHPSEAMKAAVRYFGPFAMRQEVVQRTFRNTLEEMTIAYPQSPIVRDEGGGDGPRAGDRAPSVPVVRLTDRRTVQLFDLLRGTHWTLLVLLGDAPTAAQCALADEIATSVLETHGTVVQPYLVAQSVPAAGQHHAERLLMDRVRAAHAAYGSSGGALVLLRPDWYIGFRGPLDRRQQLRDFMQRVFIAPPFSGGRP